MSTESVEKTHRVALGKELGTVLCEAFGIDRARVRRITVDASANGLAIVTVERFVEHRDTHEDCPVLELIRERFDVVQKEEAERNERGEWEANEYEPCPPWEMHKK